MHKQGYKTVKIDYYLDFYEFTRMPSSSAIYFNRSSRLGCSHPKDTIQKTGNILRFILLIPLKGTCYWSLNS